MNAAASATLLSVIELLGYPNMRPLYERLGYRVLTEFSVRRAIGSLRREKPAVIVADFYFQPDFRDRVSNLESLLASVQAIKPVAAPPIARLAPDAGRLVPSVLAGGNSEVKVLVLYEATHQHALDRLLQRFRIDAALTLPADEARLEALLTLPPIGP